MATKVAFNTIEPCSSNPWGNKSRKEAINSTPAAKGVPYLIKYLDHEAFCTKITANDKDNIAAKILAIIA